MGQGKDLGLHLGDPLQWRARTGEQGLVVQEPFPPLAVPLPLPGGDAYSKPMWIALQQNMYIYI